MFSRLRKRCRISSLSVTGVLLTLFFILLSQYDPPLLHELRLKSFDFFLQNNPAPLYDPQVIIVDVDSESLEELGQWPWPRKRIAKLLKKITTAGPAVIGLDMIFAEPDSSSPHILGALDDIKNAPAAVREYLQDLPDYDRSLAQALEESPAPVVLGYVFTGSAKDKAQQQRKIPRKGNLLFYGHNPLPFLFPFNGIDSSLEMFERTAQGIGFLNIIPDIDSIIRNIPLVVNYRNEVFPSLVLTMLQAATGEETIALETDQNGIRAVQTGGYRIPTNMNGELIVNFSGPARTLPYVSAHKILSGQFDAEFFRNAYVLIGTSAPGLFDLRAVPTDRVFPGVELHGHALNTILSRNFLRRPEWAKGAELLYICCISLLLILVLSRMDAAKGALLVLLLSLGVSAFSYWCMRYYHLQIDMVYPLMATWLLFTVLTFYSFITGEKKIRRLRSTFSHYLSPEVVKELLKNQDDLVLDGEERELSILFSDIRRFTSMAEMMSPDDLCVFLNEYLTPMTEAIMERRGTVDKFIGDAIMAFWNAPLDTPNHVFNTCECALAMLNNLEELNKSWSQRKLPEVRIGVGIHCGVARVGNMGSQQRFDYTIMGDAVNLASRIEGLTRLYGVDILVSDAVYAILKESDFFFRQIDTVRAVGKTTPVTLYQLTGLRKDQTPETLQEVRAYYAVLDLYNAGAFAQASQAFQALKKKYPHERLYQVYSERCARMAKNPPEQWSGITDIQMKRCL
ncbi:adenylate/guanylate cyclase domain-containing protein [Desulfobulbus sp. US4]|nr:adenylate/guanylate cyclase domain-containing protein [Desulfobulbus sp. US4]